jgi:hypothetical protein
MAILHATFQTGIHPYNPWSARSESKKPNLLIPISVNDGNAVAVARMWPWVWRLRYVDVAIAWCKARHSVMRTVDIK